MTFEFDPVRIATSLAIAGIGFLFSRTLPRPHTAFAWTLWVVGTLLAGHVMTSLMLVGFRNTGVYFNDVLQGLGMGILLGFVVRRVDAK